MKSMEEMIQAAQAAAQTIQKQMEEAQGKLEQIEVEGHVAHNVLPMLVGEWYSTGRNERPAGAPWTGVCDLKQPV